MSTVEDRLRDALAERAARSPVDPDAWEKTVARTRRSDRAGGWFRFGIPAAAAAAVAAIVVGATALTGGLGGPRGGSAGATPTLSPSGMPAPPGPNDYSMKSAPPVTAVVPVKLIADGQTTWTFVWFGYLKNDRAEGLVLCTVTDGDGYGGGGGCGPEDVPAGQAGYSPGPYGSITMGTALKDVTAVSARLPGARTVPGVVVSGRGFPYKFWAVVRPAGQSAQIIFRGAGGAELGHLAMPAEYPAPSRPRGGGILVFRYPAGVEGGGPGRMTAYLLNGRVLGARGTIVGFWDSAGSSAVSTVPVSGPPAVAVFNTGGPPKPSEVVFYGYAHENVTRVVLRLADGRQYGADTFAAWPGSGLRLWAFAVPGNLAFAGPRSNVMLAYNAAGQVVWQQKY
jgi:hypothetical protein